MMANTSPRILGKIKVDRGRLKVDNNVSIPRIEGTDQEKGIVQNAIL